MSDFDDEPVEGSDQVGDDWDDEPTPKPKAKAKPKAKPKADPDPVDDWDDDWDDDDSSGGGRRDMTLVYAVVAAAIVIVLAVVLTRPKDDNGSSTNNADGTTQDSGPVQKQWQGPVGEAVGDVEARLGDETGVFIWTDFEGWHVRSSLDTPVTVVVRAPTVLQKDADGKTSGDPKTEISATIEPGDTSKGADFDLQFAETATFEVTAAGAPVPAGQVLLGGKGQADQNPVTFTKA